MLPPFAYARPARLEDAILLLSEPGARAHAGGTDLLGCLRDGVLGADRVVSLSALPGLRGISAEPEGGLRIGAMTSLAEIARHPEVGARWTALSEAAAAVGSPQLRAQGTIGGNLLQKPRCWYYRGDFRCLRKGGEACLAAAGENAYHAILGGGPCFIVHPSDTAPALIALDARVRIAGPSGVRALPVGALHVPPGADARRESALEPGEILLEVLLPPPRPGTRSTFRKVRARGAWDFALASLALALRTEGGRVASVRAAAGGVAPIPWRLSFVEEALRGHALDRAAIARAADAAVEGAQPLEQNGGKVPLLRGLVEERLAALA